MNDSIKKQKMIYENLILWLLLTLACLIATYTQFKSILDVPGFHFDEAWQALFAAKIALDKSFRPSLTEGAMNSYTSPIIHYILAYTFKIFSPTLLTLRIFFGTLNLSSLIIFLLTLKKIQDRIRFTLLWALLPLSIHNHRFYIEMTAFFGFCFALYTFAIVKWNEHPRLSTTLIFSTILFATYSHILFLSVFFATIIVFHSHSQIKTQRAVILISLLSFLLIPLTLRMGIGLKKLLPFFLSVLLFCNAIYWLFKYNFLNNFIARLQKIIPYLSLPFLISYGLLLFNGVWPYAQATGNLNNYYWIFFLIINSSMLIFVSWKSLFKKKSFISEAFFTVFLISSLMILKQSPRYYMIPTILAFIWIAENIQNPLLWIMFSLINLTAFHDYYLDGYKNQAPYDYEFRVGPFHDNARDFRAFQRVFVWLTENNCANDLAWVESDRFGKQIDFLKISAPTSNNKKPCPWPKEDLFFSYIPNYDPKFFDVRTENNTNPPWPNVKFLMHKPEWGDLALWIRKKDNQ